jgi:hypothetical protein
MNVAKVTLILILLLLLVVIFFALTGFDVRKPMVAVERILGWVVQLNQTLNRMLLEFLFNVRDAIRGVFQ